MEAPRMNSRKEMPPRTAYFQEKTRELAADLIQESESADTLPLRKSLNLSLEDIPELSENESETQVHNKIGGSYGELGEDWRQLRESVMSSPKFTALEQHLRSTGALGEGQYLIVDIAAMTKSHHPDGPHGPLESPYLEVVLRAASSDS
ncbi:MAG: hypothetical protein JWN49_126 [Parcubacteria group bacterium]|nr:hypothetical protein [Parcubacteria group bacterium]